MVGFVCTVLFEISAKKGAHDQEGEKRALRSTGLGVLSLSLSHIFSDAEHQREPHRPKPQKAISDYFVVAYSFLPIFIRAIGCWSVRGPDSL